MTLFLAQIFSAILFQVFAQPALEDFNASSDVTNGLGPQVSIKGLGWARTSCLCPLNNHCYRPHG